MAAIVRTDRELEVPRVDAALRAAGHTLTLLPDGVSEGELVNALREPVACGGVAVFRMTSSSQIRMAPC